MKPTNIIYLNIDIYIKTKIVERGDFDNLRSQTLNYSFYTSNVNLLTKKSNVKTATADCQVIHGYLHTEVVQNGFKHKNRSSATQDSEWLS